MSRHRYAITRLLAGPKAKDATPGQCIQWVPLTVCPRATTAPLDVLHVCTDAGSGSGGPGSCDPSLKESSRRSNTRAPLVTLRVVASGFHRGRRPSGLAFPLRSEEARRHAQRKRVAEIPKLWEVSVKRDCPDFQWSLVSIRSTWFSPLR